LRGSITRSCLDKENLLAGLDEVEGRAGNAGKFLGKDAQKSREKNGNALHKQKRGGGGFKKTADSSAYVGKPCSGSKILKSVGGGRVGVLKVRGGSEKPRGKRATMKKDGKDRGH